MKQCHCAPASQLAESALIKVLPAGRGKSTQGFWKDKLQDPSCCCVILKTTGQKVWVVMRDLEKPRTILSCVSTPAQAEQTNSNIQTPAEARHKAGNEKL